MPGGAVIRPMRPGDVDEVERLTGSAYLQLDVATRVSNRPQPTGRDERTVAQWRNRCMRSIEHDPGGCWVAETDAALVGVAISARRELMWILSGFAVAPAAQGSGLGARLLDAALSYGAGCLRGMLASSIDPRAVRRYRLAGFTLHPTMVLEGPVDRALLPVVDFVREGTPSDRDLADSVDRLTRGAAHGPDHESLAALADMLVVDRPTGQGYAYVRPGGSVALLAATNMRTAQRLLWECLSRSTPDRPVEVSHVSAEQEWAVDVAMAARLEVHVRGYLALRHMRPPAPYLPSGYHL
jgi:GNAT superfamily N-acetyltransferase